MKDLAVDSGASETPEHEDKRALGHEVMCNATHLSHNFPFISLCAFVRCIVPLPVLLSLLCLSPCFSFLTSFGHVSLASYTVHLSPSIFYFSLLVITMSPPKKRATDPSYSSV